MTALLSAVVEEDVVDAAPAPDTPRSEPGALLSAEASMPRWEKEEVEEVMGPARYTTSPSLLDAILLLLTNPTGCDFSWQKLNMSMY